MPKVSVYLPDDLYRRARDRGLPISALAQHAIEDALRGDSNQRWIDAARQRPSRSSRQVDVSALLDEVREEFGS
jgi:post-segregation antitoxin (ccd killing protein)